MSDGKSSTTIRTRIRDAAAQLTASERKIANAILADYPFNGLESIQELAAKDRGQRTVDHPFRQQDRLRAASRTCSAS